MLQCNNFYIFLNILIIFLLLYCKIMRLLFLIYWRQVIIIIIFLLLKEWKHDFFRRAFGHQILIRDFI